MVWAIKPGSIRAPGCYGVDFNPATNPNHPALRALPAGTKLLQLFEYVADETGKLCRRVCFVAEYILLCNDDKCGPAVIGQIPIIPCEVPVECDPDCEPECVTITDLKIGG